VSNASKTYKELIKSKITEYDKVLKDNKFLVDEISKMEEQVKALVEL